MKKQPLSNIIEGNFAKELAINSGKLPPNSVDFEKLVLGAVLIDSKAIDIVKKSFSSEIEIFYDLKHQLIYEAILHLNEKDYPIDLATVIQELRRTEKLEKAGGDNYIIELSMSVSSSAHLEFHCFGVLEKFLSRKLINACAKAIDYMYQESTDFFVEFDKHIREINDIEDIIAKQKNEKTALELHQELIEQQKTKIIPGVPSKHHVLEKHMKGWRDGSLNIIGARPGMGKTTFILDEVFSIAKRGNAVAFFSLEMGALELHEKLVANETEIPLNAIRDRILSNNQMEMLYETNIFDNLPFHIIDNTDDINQIFAKLRILKKEKNIKIAVIDYLQLMEGNFLKGMNREQVVSTISRKCKKMARELNIPVVVLSQLSRAVEQRPNKRPQLSDLRDSGAIEQDADTVSFLYRPEYYKIEQWEDETPTANEVEFIRAKFRGGAPFEERLKFRGDISKFFDVRTDFGSYKNPVPQGSLEDAFGGDTKNPFDEFDNDQDNVGF